MNGKNQQKANQSHRPPNDLQQTDRREEEERHQKELQKQRTIQKVKAFVHAYCCREQQCGQNLCATMKDLQNHTRICVQNADGNCSPCKTVMGLLCYHAKDCNQVNCLMPFCSNIKQKLGRSRNACQTADPTINETSVDATKNIQAPHFGGSNAAETVSMNNGAATQGMASTISNNENHGLQQALQQLTTILRNVNLNGADKQQQILNILKANPQIMTAFINARRPDYLRCSNPFSSSLSTANGLISTNPPFCEQSSVSSTNTQTLQHKSIPIEYRECMARMYDQTGSGSQCGKVIEDEIYEKAESKQEYCELMFNKIYADQMEMNKTRMHEVPTMRTIGPKTTQMAKKLPTLMKARKCVVFKRKFKQITPKYRPNMKLIRSTSGHIVVHRMNCQRSDRPVRLPTKQTLNELKILRKELDKVSVGNTSMH